MYYLCTVIYVLCTWYIDNSKKKLVNESELNEKIETLATKEEIKKLPRKAESKPEHDKKVKLQTYNVSLFMG